MLACIRFHQKWISDSMDYESAKEEDACIETKKENKIDNDREKKERVKKHTQETETDKDQGTKRKLVEYLTDDIGCLLHSAMVL